jgi:surfactin synthase thioesterase subunit
LGFVLQVTGEVNPVKLKLPGQNRIIAEHSTHIITQLQAHLSPNKVLVHATFAGFDGKVIGGKLAYGTTIASETEIILGYKPLGLLPVDAFFSKFTENE